MIVAHTDYDQVAAILSSFAAEIDGSDIFQMPNAQAHQVCAMLLGYQGLQVFCFYGHGDHTPPRLRDQSQQHILPCSNQMTGWVVYGAACYSLGPVAGTLAASGVTVIGFTDELQVPVEPEFEAHRECLKAYLRAIPDALRRGDNPAKAMIEAAQRNYSAAVSKLYREAHNQKLDKIAVLALLLNKDALDILPARMLHSISTGS